MKLRQYLKQLNELVEVYPDALEFDVYSASDDEGNSYNKVIFDPSLTYIDEDGIIANEDWDEYDISGPNAVVIN